MFGTFKSTLRALGGLALFGAAAAPLQALAADAAAAPAAEAQSLPLGATTALEQVVVRDAATGQLRAATADEAQTMQQSRVRSLRSVPAAPMSRAHYSGARGVRLTDEFMSYSVVMRGADGKLVEYCFSSREAAEAAVKSDTVVKAANLPTE